MAVSHRKHDYTKFVDFTNLKVGDRVRVRSIDWYNQNKAKSGPCSGSVVSADLMLMQDSFTDEMVRLCGREAVVTSIFPVEPLRLYREVIKLEGVMGEDIDECFSLYSWHDWMLEGGPDIPKKWDGEVGETDYWNYLFQDHLDLL